MTIDPHCMTSMFLPALVATRWYVAGFCVKLVCHGYLSFKPRSMGSTLRTRDNPLGRLDSEAVKNGNLLCSRALVLMLLCAAKGIFWCLEQPGSSTMEWHPLFQQVLRLVTVRRHMFRMSQFGSATPKRTILYSSSLNHVLAFDLFSDHFQFAFAISKAEIKLSSSVPSSLQATGVSHRSWTTWYQSA